MVEQEKSELKKPCREYAYIVGTVVLALVAVLGPVYAFTLVSCVSTHSCKSTFALAPNGAWCEEGSHLEEEMLHGETCTVHCPVGRAPTVPELHCDDGLLHGADLLCAEATTSPQPAAVDGLVAGAIVGVEPGRACVDARNVQCDAAPGDTGVLLVLYELPLHQCQAILEECQQLNSNFLFVQHMGETSDEWVCTFGCRSALATVEAQSTQPAAATTTRPVNLQTPSLEARGCDGPPQGPFCFQMSGSCHEADNGDYYKAETCVSGSPQWIKEDGTRRIRKDPVPLLSLGGRWILEADFDADSDNYGNVFIARQPTFAEEQPIFEDHVWNFECRVPGSIDLTIVYQPLRLDLVECSCTREGDCNGRGAPVGSKEEGPNCGCVCDEGFLGDRCDTRYCEAPEVFGAYLPGCAEGLFIAPGDPCTPNCFETRTATVLSMTCVTNENDTLDVALVPPLFECTLINDLLEQNDPFFTDSPPTTTTLLPCTNAACEYHGVATGFRYGNNDCECLCDDGFSGRSCQIRSGSCAAPRSGLIERAEQQPCAEGINNISVGGVCTGQCNSGYYAVPGVLSCDGPGRKLAPEVFRCFSSQTVEQQWCEVMQYMSLTVSGLALLVLVAGCSMRGKRVITKLGATFVVKGTLVEHHELKAVDVHGDKGYIHVVRPADGKVPSFNARQEHLRLVVKPQPLPAAPAEDDMVVVDVAAAETVPIDVPEYVSIDPEQSVELPGIPVSLQDVSSDLEGGWDDFGLDEPTIQEPTIVWASTDRSGFGARAKEVTDWLVHKQELEDESNARRAEQDVLAEQRRRQSELVAAADVSESLRATEMRRAEVAAAIVDAFSSGDGDALREAINHAKVLLTQLSDAPKSTLLSLNRLLHLGEGRLLQYETKALKDADKQKYEEKKLRGEVADWAMTQEELWMHVEQFSLSRVKAGLKAHLLVNIRTKDKHERTLLHIACMQLAERIDNSSQISNGVAVIRELVQARANTAAIDTSKRTPLDLLLDMSDLSLPDDTSLERPHPVLHTLLGLGLQQSESAAQRLKAERMAREAVQSAQRPLPRASSKQSLTCHSASGGRSGSARRTPQSGRRSHHSSRGSLQSFDDHSGSRVLMRPGTVDNALRKSAHASPHEDGQVSFPLQAVRPSTTGLIVPKPQEGL